MSALHISLDCLPSLCQKLSELMEIRGSYDKDNFACFFLRHGELLTNISIIANTVGLHVYISVGFSYLTFVIYNQHCVCALHFETR